MSTVDEIEAAIQALSPEERARFRAWFADYDAKQWDEQLSEDASSGRLDWLADEVASDRDANRLTDR